MPVRKEDAHRALQLMEDYYQRLEGSPREQHLQEAVGKVIHVFKSRLFNALIDIQDFYEVTLLDSDRSPEDKAVATLKLAEQWSEHPAITSNGRAYEPASLPPPMKERAAERKYQGRYAVADHSVAASAPRPPVKVLAGPPSSGQASKRPAPPSFNKPVTNTYSTQEHMEPDRMATPDTVEYEFDEIHLEKGDTGLGFTIAGGNDSPHVANDPRIYITEVLPSGAAFKDGRLTMNDILISVNGTNVEDVTHNESVTALHKAGNVVDLVVKRPRPMFNEDIVDIHLVKNAKGLGFSIAGGKNNQHIPGDDGIFITKIIPGGSAEEEGTLTVGDRLLSVNDVNLECITHEMAVEALKATKTDVRLLVVKSNFPAAPAPPEHELAPPPPPNAVEDDYRPSPQSSSPEPNYPPPSAHVEKPRSPRTDTPSPPPPQRLSPDENVTPNPKDAPQEQELTRDPRYITLSRLSMGFGFNIVGGEDGEGLFVSFITAGGSADLSGLLKRGDQILAVDGVDMRNTTHEAAVAVLKNAGSQVEVLAQYRPEAFNAFEAKLYDLKARASGGMTGSLQTTQKKSFYVRALFDYDPSCDSGLPSRGLAFRYGDILHVTNASDDEWWQAKLLPPDSPLGIVPAKLRVERKDRAKARNVKFHGKGPAPGDERYTHPGSGGKKKNFTFAKKFSFSKKSKENLSSDENVDEVETLPSPSPSPSSPSAGLFPHDVVLSYEAVTQQELDYSRPLIILGQFKDRVNDYLINDRPDKFGSCVPHTSRKPREHEKSGRDYHFVASREQMEKDIANHLFIEAGQYNDNLYGTSVESVREIARGGKHCILDVSGLAIKRLQVAGLYPIAIFIRPRGVEQIRESNKRWTEEQCQKAFDKMLKLEQEFGEYFTAVLEGDAIEQVYDSVKALIEDQSGPNIWVPSKDKI